MFTRCLFCHQPFPPNQSLEHFPVGRRVAYDPGRGRLWAICDGCGRWSLAPIEERWEALEELEKLTTDRAKLLSQTEHIALLRAEDLDIVRVGRARLREEAWWRYGKELVRRRAHTQRLRVAQTAVMIGAAMAGAALGGLGMFGFYGGGRGRLFMNIDRWRKFGRTAWRGGTMCPRCGMVMERIGFRDARNMIVHPDGSDGLTLHLSCPRCGWRQRDAGFVLEGVTADHVLRRVLAYQNFSGASERTVKEATQAIEELGSPNALTRRIAAERVRLGDLAGPRRQSRRRVNRYASKAIAFEIAVNDETERRLLELELAALESRWREEEEIAAISDGELTPLPRLNELLIRTGIGAPGRASGLITTPRSDPPVQGPGQT